MNAAFRWKQCPDTFRIPRGADVVSTRNPVSCKTGLNSLINTCGGVVFYWQICRISTLCNCASEETTPCEGSMASVSQFGSWSPSNQLHLSLTINPIVSLRSVQSSCASFSPTWQKLRKLCQARNQRRSALLDGHTFTQWTGGEKILVATL